ncbi:MAG: cupin domain-containing protein [Clostridia bacterium]|nr:cupin domain-containing protein [Clostridia bacterium]
MEQKKPEYGVCYGKDVQGTSGGQGVTRRILSYSNDAMCVENVFEKGAVGALHSHPHTQITYVVSGTFEFTIGDEKFVVKPGDTLLKKDGVIHGCVAPEGGVLIDFFTPCREDFLK